MCLPISPKFFHSIQDSKFWSGLKISLHSLIGSKTQFTQISNVRSDKAKLAKQSNGSHNLKALSREYNVSSQYDIEHESTLWRALMWPRPRSVLGLTRLDRIGSCICPPSSPHRMAYSWQARIAGCYRPHGWFGLVTAAIKATTFDRWTPRSLYS